MTRLITKDTVLCMSLAARPSNFGTRFHNFLYEALDINYIYKAFTTNNLAAAIGGVRALGIRGCAVSMPFKEACIAMVDELDTSAKVINSVNTIVNTAGKLKAYNTDYIAISSLLKKYHLSADVTFVLQGSGGMAKAVACALKDAGFNNGYIVARNESTGRPLADLYGFEWVPNTVGVKANILINVTPIGMKGGAEEKVLAFSEDMIDQASVVFDVVAMPSITPLIAYAKSKGKVVITGAEVFAIQAVEQFVLYTGIRPSNKQFQEAASFARG
jgi:shikimate dehydrogenase